MNFLQLTLTDLAATFPCLDDPDVKRYVANIDELSADELLDSENRYYKQLECVEDWARNNGLIAPEEECSEKLRDYLLETMPLTALVKMQNDNAMQSEFESGLMDTWEREGVLHRLQVSNYSVTIDYSDVLLCAANN